MADTLVLNRNVQVGIKEEAEEGTPETLAAADFAAAISDDASISMDVGEYEMKQARGSFSPQPVVKGARLGTLKCKAYLVGGSASTEPVWGRYLRACSFKKTTAGVVKISVGARTGREFRYGDLVGEGSDYASSTKKGRVVAMVAASQATAGTLFIVPVAGTFATSDHVKTFTTTAVDCTASGGATAAGRHYVPFTETADEQPPSFTIDNRIGGEQRVLTGVRATATISLKFNEPGMLDVEAKGAPVLDENGRWPTPGQMANVPSPGATPLASLRLPCRMGKDDGTDYRPILTDFSLNLNNQLTGRETFTDADYAGSGYRGVRVTGRKPSAKINPEYVVGEDLDAVKRTLEGGTFQFSQHIGKSTHANGLVVIAGPACQFTGGSNEGDRNGIKTIEPEMLFTGSQDDEVEIFHVFE